MEDKRTQMQNDIVGLRKFDLAKMAVKPNDPVKLMKVTDAWLKLINGFKESDPEMAVFAREQFAILLAGQNHNKAGVDNVIAGGSDMVTPKGVDCYVDQCLPRHLVKRGLLGKMP